MQTKPLRAVKILLLGLEECVSRQLRPALSAHMIHECDLTDSNFPEFVTLLRRVQPDIVFCASDASRSSALLKVVKQMQSNVPVVLVSRTPEISAWLDGMEAGASDYCSAPFETSELTWILESNLLYRKQAAA